jgi:putative ABC transport system permease protein
MPWAIKMAWRDSRGSRKRLLLATAAVALGTAAVVAISSFAANVQEAVLVQAKTLLGADLVVSSRRPFTQETEALLTSIRGEQARETSFTSMAYFPKSDGTRLVQVRALDGPFPFYGIPETDPPGAFQLLRKDLTAIVEDSLLLQFDVQVGEAVKIGAATFRIVGRLKKIPGEAAAALISPRVYIPMAALQQTALLQKGSLVTYKAYFQLPAEIDADGLLETLQPQLNQHRLEGDTAQKRAARLGRVMDNLSRFLNLVGFIALLLGSISVASAIHGYIREKLDTIAVLRCVGLEARRASAVYLIQAGAIGCVGAVVGTLIGVAVQLTLPSLLQDFLPVRIAVTVSWGAMFKGLAMGAGIPLLFALLPLGTVRKISPLRALRASYEGERQGLRDPWLWFVVLLICAAITAFALTHTERWTYGLGFCAALGVAFGLLMVVAKSLVALVKAYFPSSWPYVWRQGLANLSRPQNQTLLLVLALGLGTFLLLTVFLTQRALLQQVMIVGGGNQPNLILFDVQNDQREEVANLVRSFSLPVLQQVPLVTMRLAAVKGKSVVDLRNATDEKIPDWALQWEYRATYRGHLIDTEALVVGEWRGNADGIAGMVPVSLEEEIAQTLGVTVGDELVFDVQGVPITTTVGSIRKVDWQRVQPNFFVVFPTGVLEAAPQIYVLVTRVPSNELSATVQRAVVQRFPNVSAIDLTLILHTFDGILRRVSFAIRFMAFFSILVGLFVLTGAVVASRSQRLRESVLLRTLGASGAQIRKILLVEYLFLGSFAAVTGILLAVTASWAVAYFLFEIVFVLPWAFVAVAFLLVVGLTVLVGVIGSRGILSRPPLEVLRSET